MLIEQAFAVPPVRNGWVQGMKRSKNRAEPDAVRPAHEPSGRQRQKRIPEESVRDLAYVDVSGLFYCKVKRGLDVLLSLIVLVVLSVPMGLLALIIYLDDPGPIFFAQSRVGRHGESFPLYKFRTMRRQTPQYRATGELDEPGRYITRIGRFLRRSSLDELPQLWNVLRGDMSLVGPRPLIAEETEIHAMRMRFGVYNVRPGITGLAQVNGRDRMDAAQKLRWDVRYLKAFGFRTDRKVFLATIPCVLKQEGYNEGGLGPDEKK